MAKFLIIATKKSELYPNTVSEIEAYGIYTEKTPEGKLRYKTYTKGEFFRTHWKDTNEYWTYNVTTEETSLTYRREITAGKPFLQSVSDSQKSDNLLNLPDIR